MRQVYWDSDDMLRRLKRIEGQVRGIQAMIEREETCQDILVQVAAVEGAIQQVARIVSACSVAETIVRTLDAPPEVEAMRSALARLLK
jgi:DNA-binding FrmR family transcriptional regulator